MAANVVGTAATQAGVGAAAAAAQGQDPLEAAAAGALGGAIGGVASPWATNLGTYMDMGSVGHGIAGGLVGGSSRALSDTLLGNDISPMGLAMAAGQGAWGGYNNAPSIGNGIPTDKNGEYQYDDAMQQGSTTGYEDYLLNGDVAGQLGKNLPLLNYDETQPTQLGGWTSANPANPDNPDYKGTFYNYGDLMAPPKWSDGLSSKVAKGLLGAASDYMLDRANKMGTDMSALKPFVPFTSPNFAGSLMNSRAAQIMSGDSQASDLWNWQRTTSPDTPVSNMVGSMEADNQPAINQASGSIGSRVEEQTKAAKGETKEDKKKKSFNSKSLTGWRDIA